MTDPEILGELLAIHHAPGSKVADQSGGLKRLWTQALIAQYQPIFVDIDPAKEPDIVGDWNQQHTYFVAHSIGTELWDPPMIGDAGRRGLVGGRANGYGNKYGTGTEQLKGATAVVDLFAPFLDSAWQSLEPGRGTLICKIADQVHAQQLQFQPYCLWRIATERGWFACDRVERERAQPPHNTTLTQRHIRRGVTHWLVFHNTAECPGEGIAVRRHCDGCDAVFVVRRSDQQTCGQAVCRQRVSRMARAQSRLVREKGLQA